MPTKVQKVITLDHDEILTFCGERDRKLKSIQSRLKAKIVPRGNELRLSGSTRDVQAAHRLITDLLEVQRSGHGALSERQIHHAINHGESDTTMPIKDLLGDAIAVPLHDRSITALTQAQKLYIQTIRDNDITFAIGPAGTGKTYLAMALAVESLMQNDVDRIILVRPVVEAGEKLGFLPGDIAQKFDPFVRPLYDALYDMIEREKVRELIDNETIEIAPLAYMRGRTLSKCFAILDEAQNTSAEQMKMFLTRMGFGSKLVITGDVTQVDLPKNKIPGLTHAQTLLADIEGIGFIRLTHRDVVRHELVQKIVMAYDAQRKR